MKKTKFIIEKTLESELYTLFRIATKEANSLTMRYEAARAMQRLRMTDYTNEVYPAFYTLYWTARRRENKGKKGRSRRCQINYES